VVFDFNSRILGGRMFSDGGEHVNDETSIRFDPFPAPKRPLTVSIREALRAWKRQRWLRQRRASITTPFD